MNKNARKIRNALFNSMGENKEDDKLHSDAADLIARQSSKIKHEITKKKRLMQENEELRNQVYNLTLYIEEVNNARVHCVDEENSPYWTDVLDFLEEQHPGIPGYNPAILEVQHGTND